ncbi:tesmin TSO1-like CXC domain protein (macronuclear) [Tetrahymena thermophila SB210]|uniref:Tesmin TSO1-like CXC domain protein n=1 Tax=Tetrahymena thermophila (strain SB210) TaxID=312017 RepID=I7MDV4_TETTS|nr:tesmin TSO1-like CXC domain protein [Tetrahymena thermophila SB210]EAR91019.2 tesmin TSO1-like CXC domain protein [Tetrahymena thermophila SB210]|eukprot:XP_001011264.2 tesmin TSO1-like CXC domain protein [Tetrahymena thermophila SB210]
MSINNQQSCYSFVDLSPVINFTSCLMPVQTKITNFLHGDNRPSTLNQLPSQNNIGSAIFDKTEDPKINFNKNHYFAYNPNLYIFDASSHHNLYFPHNNPETNDFSQQDEMNHINHKLDSVSILVKKDISHDNVQQQEPFDTEQEVGMPKYSNICTPPTHSNNSDLFGMVQIQPDSKYLQTLTPTQKNNSSQYSPKSNIPTPNITQAISSASDKMNQCAFSEQQQFKQLINNNNYLNNNPIYSNQNAFGLGKQEYFQGVNNPINGFNSSLSNNLQNISKNKTHENIKEEMKKRQEQLNQGQSNYQQNYNHYKINAQSTSSINSQASISSTSSINDQSISNQNNSNNNVCLKINYPLQYGNSNQMHGMVVNSLTSSLLAGSSSHSVGGIYTANKLNIPISMTTSVNNTIVEEKERDFKDRNQQNSKDSNSDDEGYDNSNKQAVNIDMQEFARKVDFCKCKKSKCLKLYCECFLRGNYCNDQCICTECGNNDKNLEEREKAIDEAKTRNQDAFNLKFQITSNSTVTHKKGCHCKRTHCLKKYCECFNAGLKCTNNCKCEECRNTQDGLKTMGISGGGTSGLNTLIKVDEDVNSSEINSQMLQSIDYQLQQGPTERKISMCSSTGTSGLQNRKRTRSEVLDQLTSKNEIQSLQQTDQLEPEIRKKKNSLCLKQNPQNSQVNSGSQIKIKSSYQPNQTSYNSFEQNFVYPTSNKNGANFQSTTVFHKKIQS